MADFPKTSATLEGEPNPGTATGSINPPDLSASAQPRRRAIRDVAQARAIIRNFEQAARERCVKNARIASKYNSENPVSTEKLKQEGLGWKSNFSTKPLPMLINKVAPRFPKAVESAKYLTNSSLPDDAPGASAKTTAFRREITKTIRARPGWQNFVFEFSQENCLYGYTALVWLDEFRWMPKHFRQDRAFFPTGVKQAPEEVQAFVIRDTILVHEATELIDDVEAAKIAGWNLPNMVAAINSAMPENRRSRELNWERVHQDLIRESNVGVSHEAGALVLNVWHVFAQEVTGKVTHWVVAEKNVDSKSDHSEDPRDDKGLLFSREDQFESMADVLSLFSFELGNGTLHGSKGIGREIYAMASALDRARNDVMDRLMMAGKIIIQGDEKSLKKFKMHVIGSSILIGQGFNISERKIDSGVQEFLELDQFLTSLLDQLAGAVTPKALEGERVTKAAVDLLASREEESRDNILSRFMSQFANLMTTIQKRLCDPDTVEKDAKEMQARLLKIMTRDELNYLATQPIAETVRDYTDVQRQQAVLLAQEVRGNPLYDQKEVERRQLLARFDEEFATSVLIPDEDPTVTAEQTRMQQLELLIIVGQGSQVPVSPRDNHLVHLKVLEPAMESAAKHAVQDPHGTQVLAALFQHAQQHYQAAQKAGANPEILKPIAQRLQAIQGALKQLQDLDQQHQQLQDGTHPDVANEPVPEPPQLPSNA